MLGFGLLSSVFTLSLVGFWSPQLSLYCLPCWVSVSSAQFVQSPLLGFGLLSSVWTVSSAFGRNLHKSVEDVFGSGNNNEKSGGAAAAQDSLYTHPI